MRQLCAHRDSSRAGYSDWKWKNTDQEAAAAHAAAAAVATEKKEKKERVKEEAAVAARSMALSQAFRETLRHTGALAIQVAALAALFLLCSLAVECVLLL